MPVTLKDLVLVRSQIALEVIEYLEALAAKLAELPAYCPEHLRSPGPGRDGRGGGEVGSAGRTAFDHVRQRIEIAEDRWAFEQWVVEDRERTRRAGEGPQRSQYRPTRSRPDIEDPNEGRRKYRSVPITVTWDEHAAERFRRAVVLGDPGFGKTWLLNFEGRRVALGSAKAIRDQTSSLAALEVPIHARLSELNGALARLLRSEPLQDGDLVAEALVEIASAGRGDKFRDLLRDKIRHGSCVVLLDAWDEVGEEPTETGKTLGFRPGFRQFLGQCIAKFARAFPRLRILLTSRVVGYSGSLIPGAQEMEILAFDQVQIEGFVAAWFGEEEEARRTFLQLLEERPPLRGLARIPLMLALLCRTFQESRRKESPFPGRRVELYHECLKGLLGEWKRAKGYDQETTSDAHVEALFRCLEYVSFAFFLEDRQQSDEGDVANVIGDWLVETKQASEQSRAPRHVLQDQAPDELLADFKRDGIFTQVGTDLIFLHRTFHEYLAAAYVGRLVKAKGWKDAKLQGKKGSISVRDFLDKKAWLPAWEQFLVLLTGMLEDPAPLLEILTDKSKDDLFSHRLGLAGRCLAEVGTETLEALARLRDKITEDVASTWWRHKLNRTHGAVPELARTLPALAQAEGQVPEGMFCRIPCTPSRRQKLCVLPEALLQSLEDKDSSVEARAAEALGLLGPAAAIPRVIEALLPRLEDKDAGVQARAAEALGRLGPAAAIPAVIAALFQKLKDKHWGVRARAMEALGRLGPRFVSLLSPVAIPRAIDLFLQLLNDNNDLVQANTREAISRLGPAAASPRVIDELLRRLEDKHWDLRERATETLGLLGPGAAIPRVIDALLQLLEDQEAFVKVRAAEALGRLGPAAAIPRVIDALLRRLEEKNAFVCKSTAEALGRLEPAVACSRGIDALLRHLEDKDEYVGARGLEALGLLGPAAAIPRVIEVLLQRLENKDIYVRARAAEALGRLGPAAANPRVIHALLKLLEAKEGYVRRSAAEALGRLGPAAAVSPVIAALFRKLKEKNSYVWESAAEALSRLGPAAANPRVIDALLKHLKSWPSAARPLTRLSRNLRIFRRRWRLGPKRWRILPLAELSRLDVSL